jgi:hypothetical protein
MYLSILIKTIIIIIIIIFPEWKLAFTMHNIQSRLFIILIFWINMIYSLVPEGENTQSNPNQNKNNIATYFSW